MRLRYPFAALAALAAAWDLQPPAPPAPTTRPRVAAPDPSRIVQRLRPAVRIAGRPDTAFTIAERMRFYHVPGVSLAVIDANRIVHASGWGVAEHGGTAAVDTTTLFLAGSISKPVFATGALALVERGTLALDEDVNVKLRSWRLPASRHTEREPVTLRRLLSHSAGLTVWGFPGYAMGAPLPTVPQVLDGAPPANTQPVRNDTVPGARWLYSGGGITVAQLLATDAAGEPFAPLMRRLVLEPAGMRRSTFENPLPAARHREAASGHERIDTPVPGRFHVYPEMAAAGLWTTAPDLARWAIAVTRAWRGETGGVLSPAMARQMLTVQARQQPPYGTGGWGLGVAVDGAGDSLRFSHGGRDEGFVATLAMWPERGQGIVVMTNGVNGALMNEVVRAFREEYDIPGPPRLERRVAAVDDGTLAPLAGRYRLALPRDTVSLTVSHVPGALHVHDSLLQRTTRLWPQEGGGFFDLDAGMEWRFERGEDGTLRLVMGQGQGRRVAVRESGTR